MLDFGAEMAGKIVGRTQIDLSAIEAGRQFKFHRRQCDQSRLLPGFKLNQQVDALSGCAVPRSVCGTCEHVSQQR